MKVDDRLYRSIWLNDDGWQVDIIDQRRLPFEFVVQQLSTVEAAADAIRDMAVRGAPLIGATVAYGMALAMRTDSSDTMLRQAHDQLLETRPTAVNLRWSLQTMLSLLDPLVVESHEVIDIQSGSADGLKSFYPGMRSVPIVVV